MERNVTVTVRRRWVVLGVVGLVAAMIAIPAGVVWASHTFVDVPTSSTHHTNIDLIASAGVTSGCSTNPAEYCPNDPVTREQMATFLARLGGLGNNPPVVDAATLEGFGKENYVFGPDPDTTLVDQSQSFTLAGGAPSECASTMAFTGATNYRVVHQLHTTPASVDPWEVNVQVANVSGPTYDVCFASLDGSNLPAGPYETFAMMLIFP